MRNSGQLITPTELAERCAKSALFKEGYDSYMKGKPYNYDLADTSANYERGRVFAIYTRQFKTPKATWRQGILAKTARERVVQSCMLGFMR